MVGFPGSVSGKEFSCQYRRHRRWGFNPWVGKIHWGGKYQPTPEFLPEKIPMDKRAWWAAVHGIAKSRI